MHLPEYVRDVMHRPDETGVTPADRWLAAHEREQRVADDTVEVRREAQRELVAAWEAVERRLNDGMPELQAEMRWHADMIHDALLRLPAVGSHEPVLAYRGDGVGDPTKRTLYGTPDDPVGRTAQVVSLSRDLDQAGVFLRRDNDPSKAMIVYMLEGGAARDIAPFSAFPKQQEAVLPPGVETVRVDPAQLPPGELDRIRATLAKYKQEDVEIIVMREVPDGDAG
jgi:hypothetical protein